MSDEQRDQSLADFIRSNTSEHPRREIDQAILSQAKDAIRDTEPVENVFAAKLLERSDEEQAVRKKTWFIPLSFAATFLLAFGVSHIIWQDNPQVYDEEMELNGMTAFDDAAVSAPTPTRQNADSVAKPSMLKQESEVRANSAQRAEPSYPKNAETIESQPLVKRKPSKVTEKAELGAQTRPVLSESLEKKQATELAPSPLPRAKMRSLATPQPAQVSTGGAALSTEAELVEEKIIVSGAGTVNELDGDGGDNLVGQSGGQGGTMRPFSAVSKPDKKQLNEAINNSLKARNTEQTIRHIKLFLTHYPMSDLSKEAKHFALEQGITKQ